MEPLILCVLGAASAVLLWKGARKVYQAAAWRLGFERGRSAGAKEVMEHVELELGALREGLKED